MSHHTEQQEVSFESEKNAAKVQSGIENEPKDLKDNEELKTSGNKIQMEDFPFDKVKQGLQTTTKIIFSTTQQPDSHQQSEKRKRKISPLCEFQAHSNTEENSNTSQEQPNKNFQNISKKVKLTEEQEKEPSQEKSNQHKHEQDFTNQHEQKFTNQKELSPIIVQNKSDSAAQADNHPDQSKEKEISEPLLKKQKADLALEIYELIRIKPKDLHLMKTSLYQLILKIIYQKRKNQLDTNPNNIKNQKTSDKTKYHEKAREPFIEMFQKGFKINTEIFPQEKTQDTKISTDQEPKIVFHPTYFITSQVFSRLHSLSQSSILTGSDEIQKTVSVCLFWHLVKFIDQYRFESEINVSKQMMRVPKLVYWKIGQNSADPKKSFINQCPEIAKKNKLNDGSFQDWKVSIKKFYSKYFPIQQDFKVVLVMDQINKIASIQKNNAKQIQAVEKRKNQGQKINYQNIPNKKVVFFLGVKDSIQLFVPKFDRILSLSSINIQQNFFTKVKMTHSKSRNRPQNVRVKFSEKMYEPLFLIQLVDYFMFEMDQKIFKKLYENKVSEEDKKRMKNQCFDSVWNRVQKFKYFCLTLQEIRQTINGYKSEINRFKQPKETLEKQVLDSFKTMINESTAKYERLIKEYIDKKDSDPNRAKFMISVNNNLLGMVDQQRQFNQEQQISEVPMEDLYLQSKSINDVIDNRLFQYNEISKSITLLVPSSLIKRVILGCMQNDIFFFAQFTLQLLRKNKKQRQPISEEKVKKQFISEFSRKNLRFSFDLKNQKEQNQIWTYTFDINQKINKFKHSQKFWSNSSYQQFLKSQILNQDSSQNEQQNEQFEEKKNKNNSPVKFLARFKQQIKFMRKQKIQNMLFPFSKNHKQYEQQSDFDPDFVLIENFQDLRNNLISIWLVDITLSQFAIRPKITSFVKQFLNFADRSITKLSDVQKSPSVEINYIIFGPKNNLHHKDFKKVLEQEFGHQITFKTFDNSNVFTAQKLNKSVNCNLKRVGYINLGADVKFIRN